MCAGDFRGAQLRDAMHPERAGQIRGERGGDGVAGAREWVEEPSLTNESGRGAFSSVAKSKSNSSLVSLVISSGVARVDALFSVLLHGVCAAREQERLDFAAQRCVLRTGPVEVGRALRGRGDFQRRIKNLHFFAFGRVHGLIFTNCLYLAMRHFTGKTDREF